MEGPLWLATKASPSDNVEPGAEGVPRVKVEGPMAEAEVPGGEGVAADDGPSAEEWLLKKVGLMILPNIA